MVVESLLCKSDSAARIKLIKLSLSLPAFHVCGATMTVSHGDSDLSGPGNLGDLCECRFKLKELSTMRSIFTLRFPPPNPNSIDIQRSSIHPSPELPLPKGIMLSTVCFLAQNRQSANASECECVISMMRCTKLSHFNSFVQRPLAHTEDIQYEVLSGNNDNVKP